MAEIEQEIGDLKGTVRYMANSVSDLKQAVDKNNDAAASFRDHVIDELATIKTQILVFPAYVKKCEDDHETIDVRTKDLELWRAKQRGQISILMTVGIVMGTIIEAIGDSGKSILELFK